MRLREIYAKGLAGLSSPIVISVGDELNEVELAPHDIAAVGHCLESLLFPVDADPSLLREVVADGASFECGLIIQIGGHDLRLRRGLRGDTVELQMRDPRQGGFVTRARGAQSVDAALSRRLGRPTVDRFRWIHLGGSPPETPEPESDSDPFGFDSDLFGDISTSDDPIADWLQPTAFARDAEPEDEDEDGETGPHPLPNPIDLVPQQSAAPRSSEEIARLRAEYKRALEVETLEDRINEVRRRLTDLTPNRPELGNDPVLAAMRDELDGAPPVDVTDEELAVLRAPDARQAELARRQVSLETSLDELTKQVEASRSLWRSPVFVTGTVLALVCTVVSIVGGPGLRIVALGNVGCLAGSLAGVLQYLRVRDDARGHRQRVLALEEALADLEEEQKGFVRELGAVRRRHGVQTVEELEAIRDKHRQLEEAEHRARMERDALHSEQMASGADDRATLEAQLEDLESERAALGDCPLASFQIAQELRNLGLSPDGTETLAERALAGPAGAVGAVSSVGSWITDDAPPPPLLEHAESFGLIGPDGLEPSSRRLWGRMLAALLNRRLAPPNLTADGCIELSDETGLVWSTLAERERAMVIESACLMLLLRGLGRQDSRPWPWVVRLDPYAGHTTAEVERLRRLYSRITKHAQVLVLDSGRREDM